jgi:hypothetical protein
VVSDRQSGKVPAVSCMTRLLCALEWTVRAAGDA